MLTPYRQALALPGSRSFSATAFVARLPIAMIGLGIVLLVSGRTGSYAQAGALAAAFQVAAAIGALRSSRWVDQVGQGRLLPWLAAIHGAGLVAFVAAVGYGAPLAAQFAVAALAGAFQPAIGAMVRARWASLTDDPGRVRSAFAWESILDELIFTVGPLLTAFLAFQAGLPVPLVVAAVLTVLGSLALAAQHRTQPAPAGRPPRPHGVTRRAGAIRAPGMLVMVASALGIGGVFGAYEVTVVAFAQQAGQSGAAGVILGLWAFGSMISGIVFGSRQWRLPLPRQVMVLTALLTVVLVPAPFVPTVSLLAGTTFVAGMAVAPALIAVFSLTERLVPSVQLTEGLTWTNSGLALGFSGGTAVAGIVVDAVGTTWAFGLPIASAACAFIAATAGQPVLRRAAAGRPLPGPAIAWGVDPVPGPGAGAVVDDPPTP